MGIKEGFKKAGKVLNIIRWLAIAGFILAIGIGVLSGNTDSQKQAYIDAVKLIEWEGSNIEDAVLNSIYTKSRYEGAIDWEIEGDTNKGKVVTASGGGIKVRIFTIENGDYIQIDPREVIIDDGVEQVTLAQMYLEMLASRIGG